MRKSGKDTLKCGAIFVILLVFFLAYFLFPEPAASRTEPGLQALKADRPAGRQYLVLIAIDKYQFQPQLQYEVWRLRRLKQVLTSRYIFDQVVELYDSEATGERITGMLDGLQRELQSADSLLLIFFGSGQCTADGKEGYWQAADAGSDRPPGPGWVAQSALRDYWRLLPAAHLLLISDCPFASQLLRRRSCADEAASASSQEKEYFLPCRHILVGGGVKQSDRSIFAAGLKKVLDRNNGLRLNAADLNSALRAEVGWPISIFGIVKGTGSEKGSEFCFFLQPGMMGKDLDLSAYEEAEKGGKLVDFTRYLLRFPKGKRVETALLKRAALFNVAGRFRRAIAEYVHALRLNPQRDCAFANIGYCHQQLGEFLRAAQAYSKAIAINPLDGVYFLNRGVAHYSLGQTERARADYRQARQLNPDDARPFINLAVLQADRYDYAGALANLDTAIAADPGVAEAYINRGRVQGLQKKFNLALNDLQTALQLAPNNVDALANMGELYTMMGEYDKAIALASDCIQNKIGQGLFYIGRGYTYYKKGEYQQALADLNASIRLNRRNQTAYIDRSLVYLDTNQLQRAIADCNRVLVLNPGSHLAYNNRGYAYYRLKNYPRALRDYSRSIALNSHFYLSYRNRGIAYLNMNQLDAAAADFSRAIAMDATEFWDYINRAAVLFRKGAYEQAVADLQQAIAINPSQVDAYVGLGDCYEKLGKPNEAAAARDKARQLREEKNSERN